MSTVASQTFRPYKNRSAMVYHVQLLQTPQVPLLLIFLFVKQRSGEEVPQVPLFRNPT